MNETSNKTYLPKLYTLTSDYYEQGVGQMLFALICWANSQEEAQAIFAQQFAPNLVVGATVEEGIAYHNEVMKFFLSARMEDFLKDLQSQPCYLVWKQFLHFRVS